MKHLNLRTGLLAVLAVLTLIYFGVGSGTFQAILPNKVQPKITSALASDARNNGIEFKGHESSGELYLDLVKFSGSNSMADLFRCFLNIAKATKDEHYSQVHLQRKGQDVFTLDGSFYQKTGSEFGTQNVIYTTRTFPQNLRRPGGGAAFETWTGGWLGVSSKQMEDFNNAMKQWIGSPD